MIKKILKVPCEIYSRVSGFYRPVSEWNRGKKEEFKDRKVIDIKNIKRLGDKL